MGELDPRVRTDPLELPVHVDVMGVRHRFGDRVIFEGLSCRFTQGKISCILGASGVGKSTLLRMMATILKPDAGDIWVGDDEITCMPDVQARAFRRRIGMMFQGGALLDSMTVFDNVALPLREHSDLTEEQIMERVHGQFEAVGLQVEDELLPAQISGGMKKRLALARAMITEPEILLCDEPFSGLDPIAVRMIEHLLVETKARTDVTMILTNHHIGSTMRLADHVVFLVSGGAISGSVREFRNSIDPRVTAFLDAAAAGPAESGGAGV
jgi:phospholipid/cholesterol/gamma-HCH transport system ATP-binding protein